MWYEIPFLRILTWCYIDGIWCDIPLIKPSYWMLLFQPAEPTMAPHPVEKWKPF